MKHLRKQLDIMSQGLIEGRVPDKAVANCFDQYEGVDVDVPTAEFLGRCMRDLARAIGRDQHEETKDRPQRDSFENASEDLTDFHNDRTIEYTRSERGFVTARINTLCTDNSGTRPTLRVTESSAAMIGSQSGPFVWVGDCHLDMHQLGALVFVLQHMLDHGHLPDAAIERV